MEASLHLDLLSLFWNIWTNPQTKIFHVIRYLLMMSNSTSLTWAAHVRTVFLLYSLPDPLQLLDSPPWSKERWKNHTNIVVISHHEAALRLKAVNNIKLQYLNVSCTGLTGKSHPMLTWIQTTQDVVVARPHVKMLAGDYLCYAFLAHDRGGDPHCRLCHTTPNTLPTTNHAPVEDYQHLLTQCRATADTREDKLTTLINTVAYHSNNNSILNNSSPSILTQFLLDCTSLNLPTDVRIPPDYPGYTDIARQCSVTINAIHRDRRRQLQALGLVG